ncbi:MAG: hypothetical protein AAF589_05960 [Planctomycetota bacterium]
MPAALGIAGMMFVFNGGLAAAQVAASQEHRQLHPVVWWLAMMVVIVLHVLAYGLSKAKGQQFELTAAVAMLSVFASMQLSFLWQHHPFRNPQSALRNP